MPPFNGTHTPDLATVNAFLDRLGLGRLGQEDVATHPGRHKKCSGTTSTGRGVFVKQLNARLGCPAPGLGRVASFERMEVPGLRTPRLLGVAEEHNLLAFDLIADAEPADELARESRFPTGLARQLGEVIGRLHNAPPPDGEPRVETAPPLYPPLGPLEGLPLHQYQHASAALLQGWRLLQQDEEAKTALRELRHAEEAAPRVPAHCDFRLDQVLVLDGAPHIIDWEEFRLADPARDVGMFVGEWLYLATDRAARVLNTGHAGQSKSAVSASRDEVMAQAVIELEAVAPRVREFWAGYRSERPRIDPDLPRRAVSFAGWHLYDRMFSVVANLAILSMTHYVANGIGRKALMAPEQFAGLLEMSEPHAAHR